MTKPFFRGPGSPFSGISPSQWFALIKLFEFSPSAGKASQEIHLNYKTTLKSYDILRRIVVEDLAWNDAVLMGSLEADEAYYGGKRKGNRGRGAAGETIVVGILERGGNVSVNIVQDVSAESLMTETVMGVRRDIVYTDKWRGYDSLMLCGYHHFNTYHRNKFKQGKVYFNGIRVFWFFTKERSIQHHGISWHKFLF